MGDTSGLRLLFSLPVEPLFAAAGDVNGDGLADVVALVQEEKGVPERHRVYFGTRTPGETFAPVPVPGHMRGDPTEFPRVRGVGDVDGDGFDDIVAGTPDTGQAYLFRGTGQGLLAPTLITLSAPGFGLSIGGL